MLQKLCYTSSRMQSFTIYLLIYYYFVVVKGNAARFARWELRYENHTKKNEYESDIRSDEHYMSGGENKAW